MSRSSLVLSRRISLAYDIPEVDIVSKYGLAYGTRSSNGGNRRGDASKSKESVFVYNGGRSWNPERELGCTEVDLDNDNVAYVEINRYQYADDHGTYQRRMLDTLARRLTLLTGDDVKIIMEVSSN